MNDNKLYMYQNPQNIRNSASKTSKPVPQLDLSEVTIQSCSLISSMIGQSNKKTENYKIKEESH